MSSQLKELEIKDISFMPGEYVRFEVKRKKENCSRPRQLRRTCQKVLKEDQQQTQRKKMKRR